MDVSSESENEKLMDLAVSELGGLDILVAVAGMGNSDKKAVDIAPEELNLVNLPLENWQRVLDVNLTGLMLANRAAARRMIAAKRVVALSICHRELHSYLSPVRAIMPRQRPV